MKKYILEIATFISGAIGMIIELVAARILSPYLGSSNLIWTCIIGMMLAFMSLGYYIGGRMSDKYPYRNVMSIFVLITAVFTSIIPLLEIYIIDPLSKTDMPLTAIAIIASTLTFGIPSLFLSTVSPFAVKLKDKQLTEIGTVSGKMSSFSTIGSIIGTFLAGFILIPILGVKNIILSIVIILCILSFMLYEDKNYKFVIKSLITYFILIAIVLFGKKMFFKLHTDIILDTDSQYSRIWVKDIDANGKKYYAVQVDMAYESLVTEDNELTDNYLKYYDLCDYYNNSDNVLMIGGAAYAYPTYYLKNFEDKKIDVVEIDEKMTQISEKYFELDRNNSRINIYHQDGRTYVNNCDKKYDCILIDAFKGTNVPFQLTTYEAIKNAKNCLNEDGIVITNVLSSLEGENSKFLQYEFSTYKSVFNEVKIFRVDTSLSKDELQNIILVGFKNKNIVPEGKREKYENLLKNEVLDFSSNKNMVTDDLCPIGV